MQKWEYMTLRVRDGIVLSANDQPLAKHSFLHGIQGPGSSEVLNRLGQEGWETVAMSPMGPNPNGYDYVILLKRPLS
jgi:hypothetical protein